MSIRIEIYGETNEVAEAIRLLANGIRPLHKTPIEYALDPDPANPAPADGPETDQAVEQGDDASVLKTGAEKPKHRGRKPKGDAPAATEQKAETTDASESTEATAAREISADDIRTLWAAKAATHNEEAVSVLGQALEECGVNKLGALSAEQRVTVYDRIAAIGA